MYCMFNLRSVDSLCLFKAAVAVGILVTGMSSIAQEQPASPDAIVCSNCRAQLLASSGKATYHRGEAIKLTVQLMNNGPEPFYIPPAGLETIVGVNGGIEIEAVPPHGGHMVKGVAVADCPPGCSRMRNIVKEITEHWILLRPNSFIGVIATANVVPLSGGTYTFKVSRIPPFIDKEERAQLSQKGIPALIEKLEAPPIEIRIEE